LHLNDYALAAQATAIYPKAREVEYLLLGLMSELGELAGKVKKIIRGDTEKMSDEEIKAYMEGIIGEIGDIGWYYILLPQAFGSTPDDVTAKNLFKLADRKSRGVIQGSGDGR
jgi:NTP pyrophosphatase (non-canonical NTP hydrolase)